MGADGARVPFNDLGRGAAGMRSEIDDAIARVLNSGWYVLGPEHNALEVELAAYLGVGDAVLVANGTDALQLALAAVGVGRDDRVLTAANAGGYTSTATRALGAVPIYADVEPGRLLLTVETVAAACAREGVLPAAVVVTHLYGAAADMGPLVEWAHENGVALVEDCAQSLGATLGGRHTGSFGDVATTSFYPTKNLGALGDGGAVFTSDPAIAARVRALRQYGWSSKYHTTLAGGRNSRMDEIQAAVVRAKLAHLDRWNEARRAIHRRYEAACGGGARLVNAAGEGFVGHLAVFDVDDRARAQRILTEAEISTDVHYPVPDHRQPFLTGTAQPSLPVTEAAAGRVLSVPLFPELTADEVARICAALSRI